MYSAMHAQTPGETATTPLVLGRTEPAITVLVLGILTFGIYPLVKFWGVIQEYRRALPGVQTNVGNLFAAYLGCAIVGVLTSGILVGFLLIIGGYVVGWMLLGEVMKLRDEVRQRYGLRTAVRPADTHKGLWIAGQLLSWIVIGIVPLIIQAWWFFAEHTALAEEAELKRGAYL